MLLGCATNCFPAFFPARFAFVVAAYSAGLNALIAADGRYRSPVLLEGLPLLVRHFWSPQFFNDCCGAFTSSSLGFVQALLADPFYRGLLLLWLAYLLGFFHQL